MKKTTYELAGQQDVNRWTWMKQGRQRRITVEEVVCIKASAGPGAVPNADPLQTYNQLTG